eukprot:15344063-Ditylum_brightwellii.AAC.1
MAAIVALMSLYSSSSMYITRESVKSESDTMDVRKIWFAVIVGDYVDKLDGTTISLLVSSDNYIGLFLSLPNSCSICEAIGFAVATCRGEEIHFSASTC